MSEIGVEQVIVAATISSNSWQSEHRQVKWHTPHKGAFSFECQAACSLLSNIIPSSRNKNGDILWILNVVPRKADPVSLVMDGATFNPVTWRCDSRHCGSLCLFPKLIASCDCS